MLWVLDIYFYSDDRPFWKDQRHSFYHLQIADCVCPIQLNLKIAGYQYQIANFSWSFRTNFFHSTVFSCYIRKDDAQATFKVFWQDPVLFERCKWKNCIWIAKEDGIYIRDFQNEQDEFRYQWEALAGC
ncbi:hypothetical protein CMV_002561 [Castanea mollissima]|uniref:S-protein homolog n=1 Tax=Castanea mollissima TaxID=60419 RepID=A0A8J4RW22_9ROSI|nr:hypothetical protein CMV_002561 [Castanea mollissima]